MDIPTFLRKQKDSNILPLATEKAYRKRAALWVLRLLVDGKGYRFLIDREGFKDEGVLHLIGLEHYSARAISPKEGLQLLKRGCSNWNRNRLNPACWIATCPGWARRWGLIWWSRGYLHF